MFGILSFERKNIEPNSIVYGGFLTQPASARRLYLVERIRWLIESIFLRLFKVLLLLGTDKKNYEQKSISDFIMIATFYGSGFGSR